MDLIGPRARAQGLSKPLASAGEVVKRLVGVQAQDNWVAPYALRARLAPTSALEPKDAVVGWFMRGTLHLVAAEDAAWLAALLGPVFLAKTRPRRQQLGLSDEVLKRELARLRQALPGNRSELLSQVEVPEGQARAHLLAYAGLTGVMVRRGDTYVPMPPGQSPEDPERELARRYLAGYGPADAKDFAAWSGLPLTIARRVLPEAVESKGAKPPRVKLLGHLDPYLLGYKDRTFALDPAHAKKVNRGGGFLRPCVLVDGRVAGVWSRAFRKERMVVSIDAWDPVPQDALERELEDLGRHLNLSATIDR